MIFKRHTPFYAILEKLDEYVTEKYPDLVMRIDCFKEQEKNGFELSFKDKVGWSMTFNPRTEPRICDIIDHLCDLLYEFFDHPLLMTLSERGHVDELSTVIKFTLWR